MNRRYQRTATTITSGENRNPANADFGGSHGRGRADSFTVQACLDHANAQRNGAIEVAPPALAGLAYLAITHGKVDPVALAIGGFTLLAVIVQLRLIPVYRRLAFTAAFWSFAFPYAAVATFALHWINYGKPPGYKVWA